MGIIRRVVSVLFFMVLARVLGVFWLLERSLVYSKGILFCRSAFSFTNILLIFLIKSPIVQFYSIMVALMLHFILKSSTL